MAIKPSSAKAKGRRLQQDTCKWILDLHPELEPDDVQSRSMGAGGEDVMLSPAARRLFPYSVECKARKSLKTIYDFLAQADANSRGATPLVVMRQDRSPSLVLITADHFFGLLSRLKEAES